MPKQKNTLDAVRIALARPAAEELWRISSDEECRRCKARGPNLSGERTERALPLYGLAFVFRSAAFVSAFLFSDKEVIL